MQKFVIVLGSANLISSYVRILEGSNYHGNGITIVIS